MKRAILLTLLAALGTGCATTLTKEGAAVKVFGLDETVKDAEAAIPGTCRLLERTAPFDQQENERLVENPYARQRNEVAARGGDMLLVRSKTLIRQPSPDCAPGDKSYGCREASQTWYRVSFDYYACSPEALRDLEKQAEAAPPPAGALFTWKFGGGTSRVAVAQMKSKILEMMHEGIGTDVIVAYVKGERLKQKLTADDIIDWKKAGIDEKVIQAALGS
jgi:hypothetical protein